jgi:hypothetical protein
MLPPKRPLQPYERRLLELARGLCEDDRSTLLRFAEFLGQSATDDGGAAAQLEAEPLDIPRPDSETVVAAIRRLSATYPMLNRDDLLHQTSELMTAHVMQGQPAGVVIDELEMVFRRRYEDVKS